MKAAGASAVTVGRLSLLASIFILSFISLLLVRKQSSSRARPQGEQLDGGAAELAAPLPAQANSHLPQRDLLLLDSIRTEEESKRAMLGVNSSSECHGRVDWAAMESDPGHKRAAVFTPYNLVVGGGERYLLSVVLAMQRQGYKVDIMVLPENVCQKVDCVLETANYLRVPLDPNLLALVQTKLTETGDGSLQIDAPKNVYSAFMLLGNEKYPQWAGLGHVNMYMCQFPFDLDRATGLAEQRALASYDYVFLNSRFSLGWYNHFIEPMLEAMHHKFPLFPSFEVLHPPVESFIADGAEIAPAQPRKDIVLLGRFFAGRQSKGHISAIAAFRAIYRKLPRQTTLHFVGNSMPGHKAYLNQLRRNASGLSIKFHVSASSDEVSRILFSSRVQWHLTGVDVPLNKDPASEEHFGISVAEGMSAGTIPVVLNRGGMGDIVTDGRTGFLVNSLEELQTKTVQVFSMEDSLLNEVQSSAIQSVKAFNFTNFERKLFTFMHRGRATKTFRHLISKTSDQVLARTFELPHTSYKTAMIIEPRFHYGFEYCVKNVMYHLGEDWSLYVFHGSSNENFVRGALKGIPNVQYRNLGKENVEISSLNQLLLSPYFWNRVDALHVLFFQTDSLLLRNNMDSFLAHNYVGAPWHTGNERWKEHRMHMPKGVGNGGLSLRSVPTMRTLSREYSPINAGMAFVQEDFWYSGQMEANSKYNLAPRDVAYSFAVEVPCDDVEQWQDGAVQKSPLRTLPKVPTGLHATWYYFYGNIDRDHDLKLLLEMSVCGFQMK